MEILKRYAEKKKIFMSAFILSGIYTVLYILGKLMNGNDLSLDSSSSAISTLSTMITVIVIIFYVTLIVSVVGMVLAGVYYFVKDKSDFVMLGEFVGYAISSVLLGLSVSGINAAAKVVKAYSSGDYSSLLTMNYSGMIEAMDRASSCMEYFQWVMIIMFIFNLIVFLTMKDVIKTNNFAYSLDDNFGAQGQRIVSYDPQTGKPVYENVQTGHSASGNGVNAGSSMPVKNSVDLGSFFKSKNGKIVIGVVIAVIVAFGGYKIYDTYFNKTSINLLENVKVEFSGYDGSGRISSCEIGNIEYDKTNAELASFVNSIYLDYDYEEDLKNGDEVEITAVYNQSQADTLKLDVKGATKKVKVKGLIERYKKASDVPSKTSSNVKKAMDEEMQEEYDNRQSSYSSYKTSFVSMYYAYDKESSYTPEDYCIGIYKVEHTTNYGNTPETETFYAIAYMTDVNSEYSDDDDHYVYISTLYDSSYNRISDESQIQTALEDSYYFSDHKITKFE